MKHKMPANLKMNTNKITLFVLQGQLQITFNVFEKINTRYGTENIFSCVEIL